MTGKYSCYIIDDEPLAIEVIMHHLDKLKEFKISGTFTDAVEAYSELKRNPVDLIFLDIEMPDFNGLDFIRSLNNKPEIIVTTAYREFAVEGFELNILDYLVKPIGFERFIKSIDKFLDSRAGTTSSGDQSGHLIVRADRKFVKIDLSDVLYIEGLKDYVKVMLPGKQILTKQSIGNFSKSLNKEDFLRVHKSFIVAKRKITAYTASDIEIGEIEIPVGRAYKDDFLNEMATS